MQIGRIFGINIKIHFTWLFAFAFVAWTLATGFLPAEYPGLGAPGYIAAGAVAALLLFGSVLAHELAHAAVAIRQGMRVTGITLFIFGGAAGIAEEPRRARDEFWMAIAGPLTSVAIAVGAGLVAALLPASPVEVVIGYLALANLALAVFNMLPGFPLDGGRVFRAIVWGISGRRELATRVAATGGQVIAWGLIGWAVFVALEGALSSGLWLGLTAWFLLGAAGQAKREAAVQARLEGVPVRVALPSPEGAVVPGTSLAELVGGYLVGRGRTSVPVALDGNLLGVVRAADVRAVPPYEWPYTSVQAVMHRGAPPSVDQDESLAAALRLMEREGREEVLVTAGGRAVGLLDRGALRRFLALGPTGRGGGVGRMVGQEG
jgi:Zn-dependent protease/CBS domain-containing protein